MKKFNIELGKYLQNRRIEKGISQEQLASLMKVSRSTIGMWECGQRCPYVETVFELCDILGIDDTELATYMKKFLHK